MLEGIIDLSVGEDGTLVAHSVEGGKHELILYDLAELQVLRKTSICNAALKVSQTAICFRDVIAPGIIAMSVPSLISGLYGLENAHPQAFTMVQSIIYIFGGSLIYAISSKLPSLSIYHRFNDELCRFGLNPL